MSRNIKLHSLHFLFWIFSFLADKSGGWKLFVKPKLIIGSLILGLGFTACNTNKSDNSNPSNTSAKKSDSIESFRLCYSPIPNKLSDTTIKNRRNIKYNATLTSYYDAEIINPTFDSIKTDTLSEVIYNTNIESEIKGNINDDVEFSNDSNKIYEIADEMPEFQGGMDSLFSYLKSEIRLPNSEDFYQSRVICRFIVEKDGSIGRIEVLRKIDKWYDKEAVRVIRNMPKWIPGKHNGEVVRVWYTIPISFKLQ